MVENLHGVWMLYASRFCWFSTTTVLCEKCGGLHLEIVCLVWDKRAGLHPRQSTQSDQSAITVDQWLRISTEAQQRFGSLLVSTVWWTTGLLFLARLFVAIAGRICFLDYEKPTQLNAGDVGWQSLRVTLLGLVTLWLALHPGKTRPKRLVHVGLSRLQRPQKRANSLKLSVIGMCIIVANAHVIEAHQHIQAYSPFPAGSVTTTSLDTDDHFDDPIMDSANDISFQTADDEAWTLTSTQPVDKSCTDPRWEATWPRQRIDEDSVSMWQFLGYSKPRYEGNGLNAQSHVVDLWCIDRPSDCAGPAGSTNVGHKSGSNHIADDESATGDVDSAVIQSTFDFYRRRHDPDIRCGKGSTAQGIPPFIQYRPNPQLQPDMDDTVPAVRTGPNGPEIGGTIQAPPNWQSTPIFRAAVSSGACRRGRDGHLVVLIRSWFVSHDGLCIHQPRDFAMRPQLLVRLTNALRRTWREFLPGHETITTRAVRPTPVDADATRRFHSRDQQAGPDGPQSDSDCHQGNHEWRGLSTLVVHCPSTNSDDISWPLSSLSSSMWESEEVVNTLLRQGDHAGTIHTLLVWQTSPTSSTTDLWNGRRQRGANAKGHQD